MKKAKENFSSKSITELTKVLLDLRAKLWQAKADLMAGKVTNIQETRVIKKDIARVLTAITATSVAPSI